MEAKVYNKGGKESGKVTIPDALFGARWNADLVHQVVNSIMANTRGTYAASKDRSEVKGGGRKPWRQKGTGRARHGSRRSPIWVGGGVAHGPQKERDHSKKISKNMKTAALAAVLSKKFEDGEVIFLDSLGMGEPKTKEAQTTIDALAGAGFQKIDYKNGNRLIVAMPAKDENVMKSFRNKASALVDEVRNLNALELLSYKYLVIVSPEESVKILEDRLK